MQIKNPPIVRSLQKTGLTEKEALVYVALLELGGGYPSKIASYSGIKRATTYNILASLSIKGLINEIEKRNKIYYQIDRPSKVLSYSNTQIQRATEAREKAERILPEIEELFSQILDRPKVRYFDGPDTLVQIYSDVTSEKNYEMLGFTNANKFRNTMTAEQLESYVRTKERLNIATRGITADTPENREYSARVFANVKNKKMWPRIKFLPQEKFPFESEIIVYEKNKVGIIKLGGPNMIGVIIEDKTIHDMMKMIFELSWDNPDLKE